MNKLSKWGIHWPNGEVRDVDNWLSLGLSHFTILENEARYIPRLREASPDGIINVRFYRPSWSKVDPVEEARRNAATYVKNRGGWSMQSMRCHIMPGNEMNLPNEGGGWTEEWYRAIDVWLRLWIGMFWVQTNIPFEHLHWPALAYGHNELEFGYELCKTSLSQFYWHDSHPYWFEPHQRFDPYYGHRFVLDHEATGKPIFISEAGNFDVTRSSSPEEFTSWFQSLDAFPYVAGATPFIAEDPTGAHQSNDWSRNPAIAQAVKVAVKSPSNFQREEPKPMALKDQYPSLFAEWESAGGIENAFAAHLRGIGVLPADLPAAVGAVESAWAQLKGQLPNA